MALKAFFLIIGTSAFFAGYPTGISNVAFSFLGRSNIFSKNPIGEGVCVKVASPEKCKAVIRKPDAMPTDSLT